MIDDQKIALLIAENKAQHKAEGYKYRVVMHVHGRRGYRCTKVHYFKVQPTDGQVMNILHLKYKSTVLSDFTIEGL